MKEKTSIVEWADIITNGPCLTTTGSSTIQIYNGVEQILHMIDPLLKQHLCVHMIEGL